MKKLLFLTLSSLLISAGSYAEVPLVRKQMKSLILENKLDEAKTLADQEIESNPTNTDVIRRRGFVHFMQGNYNSAIADFSSYLRIKPGSAKGYLYRGLSYIAMGNDSTGKEDVKRALSIDPSLSKIIDELSPAKEEAAPKKETKYVAMTTKKGVPVRTKHGPVVYKKKH